VAFTILEWLFELTVMFFGLINLPATFQIMMNEMLQDLINTRKVASFINDGTVGTEKKMEHDKVVKES